MSNPEIEIYTKVWRNLKGLGYDVYPYLPKKVGYPFVHLHSTNIYDEQIIKDRRTGRAIIRVDIWHDDVDEVGMVMTMADGVLEKIKWIISTPNYQWHVLPYGISTSNLTDETMSKRLRHYIVNVELKYIERG